MEVIAVLLSTFRDLLLGVRSETLNTVFIYVNFSPYPLTWNTL